MNEIYPYILKGDFKIIDIDGNDITPVGEEVRIWHCKYNNYIASIH